jgi:hypothetical protein
MSTCHAPALNELEQRLLANGITDDPRPFASAILGLACGNRWHVNPETFVAWVEQLAVDVVQSEPK